MIEFEELRVKTPKREVLLNITSDINKIVRDSNIKEGVCRIFVPHTTAGITINENADPAVMKDIINHLNNYTNPVAINGTSHVQHLPGKTCQGKILNHKIGKTLQEKIRLCNLSLILMAFQTFYENNQKLRKPLRKKNHFLKIHRQKEC